MLRLSVLVVSRTTGLLNRMLASLASASNLSSSEIEVLCSWNGSEADAKDIQNYTKYDFRIAQRQPYHYARNMNELVEDAKGELLLLINDDVVLDPGSIDAAITCLKSNKQAGLIGARLRDTAGLLTHSGIIFDSLHTPYHQFNELISSEHQAVLGEPRPMPAVTGALMMIGRENFRELKFTTDFNICGEDVELCLDIREKLGLEVIYCPSFSGVHVPSTTRKEFNLTGNCEDDISLMRSRYQKFLNFANPNELLLELKSKTAEADTLITLKTTVNKGIKKEETEQEHPQKEHTKQEHTESLLEANLSTIQSLQSDILHWQQQNHALQLSRLQLEQELKHARRKG